MNPILFAAYVGVLLGGHFVSVLAYSGDVTLIAPNRSGVRTLINVCEYYALDCDLIFNGHISLLLFIKGIFLMLLFVAFMLMGNMLK